MSVIPQSRIRASAARERGVRRHLPAALSARMEVVGDALSRPLANYYLILGATAALLGIGLLMVLSASSVYSYTLYHNSYEVFLKQVLWVALALPTAFIAARLPQRLLRMAAWPAVAVSGILLLLTQTGLGMTVNGNRNWLHLGPLSLQPSEIAKLAIVLWAADVYARKESLFEKSWIHTVVPVGPVIGLLCGLVLLEDDLGTAMVLSAIALGILFIVGAPGKLFAIAFSVVGVGAFYLAATNPVRRARLTSFMSPFKHFHGTGWQAAHGLLGMSTGGIFGKGLGASQQKWGSLPEAHTDFIFAVIGEELGLVGTLLVLALFAVLAYAAIRLALTTRDPFARYVSAGVTIWLMAQMIINVGMVLALLPVIGIPLPLVSYGGSALLPSLVALGLLVGFARREPEAAAALRDKKRARKARGVSGLNAGPGRR